MKIFHKKTHWLKSQNRILSALSILGIILIIFSCNSKPQKTGPFTFFEQMEGTWKNNSSEQFEYWYFEKGVPRATSYKVINQKDTVVVERIKILKQGDQLFFVAILFNQKNEAPVKFVKTLETEESITFENKQHDFPQKIVYRILSPDSLEASISGLINNKEEKILFPYSRVK